MFRQAMKKAGFKVLGHDECPIAPVYLGDAKLAGQMSQMLLENYNIYVIGFSYPVVPKGQARIRCQVSAAHSQKQMQETVDAFVAVGRQLKIIS